ncbi:MAG: hypothetical protein FWD25_01215 [Clostridia bacterium]|nr:hypothetical protein [Clostridia bacterium]
MELLLIVHKETEEQYRIIGLLERKYAHAVGARHVSVVIVPYISNGINNKGKWLVHNRYPKQCARGEISPQNPEWNLFGGHCNPSKPVSEYFDKLLDFDDVWATVFDELQDELLIKNPSEGMAEKKLEIWEKGKIIGKTKATPYPFDKDRLTFVGVAAFADNSNVEYTYYFALAIDEDVVPLLTAADDYEDKKSKEKNLVELPINYFAESELRAKYIKNDKEVCDAITRLWLDENSAVLHKLRAVCSGN